MEIAADRGVRCGEISLTGAATGMFTLTVAGIEVRRPLVLRSSQMIQFIRLKAVPARGIKPIRCESSVCF
jgi:hypothetical protein